MRINTQQFKQIEIYFKEDKPIIDHNRQIIFTHIARTGGSTIETMFMGQDWWLINSHTKHIPAQVAKKIYAPYWDTYFKFAIVRNPFERIRSMWKYAKHYGLELNEQGEIVLDKYKEYWGCPVTCEHNRKTFEPLIQRKPLPEFWNRSEVNLGIGTAYSNLLTSEYKVYKFEELQTCLQELAQEYRLLVPRNKLEASQQEKPRLSEQAIEDIQKMHEFEFDTFGYDRDYTN